SPNSAAALCARSGAGRPSTMPRSTRATRTLRIAVLSLSAAPARRPSPLCHAGTGVASRRASRRRAGQRREGRLVGGQVRVAEEGEAYQREHLRVCREEARDRAEGDGSGLGDREAIGAGRDGRKRDRPEAVLDRDLEAPAVGAREQLRLPVPAVAVDRADGVDDEAGRQPPAARRLGVAGGAAAELAALGQDRGSAGAVDRAVDPAAAHQLDGRPCEVPAPHARALAPPPARGNRRVAPSPAARYKRPARRAAEVMGWRRWWKRSPE